jgi:O-methyltransferase
MAWKIIVQKFFNKFGYRLTKIRGGEKLPYTRNHPYSSYTYSPWFENWFLDILKKISDHTLVSEDRCYTIHMFSKHCRHLEGDFAECGIYKGGTAYLISLILKDNSNHQKTLHLFDTFSGMPKSANEDKSHHKEGDYDDTSVEAVKDFLSDYSFVEFHPGLIPDTFEAVTNKKFAFVHIDVDIYQSIKDCCEFFYERMTKGGIMIFDDYGFQGYELAAKKAVDDFFIGKSEIPITLRNGQCLVLKT